MGAFFGELYLRSTRPFLAAGVTEREVEYLGAVLREHAPPGGVLDLGCGHGRHASRLPRLLGPDRPIVGIDSDPLSLAEREPGFGALLGDLRALPVRPGALGAAYAWYSTLFGFDEPAQRAILREVGRCLRPGGLLVLQTLPRERLEEKPEARFTTPLPGGGELRERSVFDRVRGVDESLRELRLPDGRVLSGRSFIRYYRAPELVELLGSEGFEVGWIHGNVSGDPLEATSTDLIVGAVRNA